MAVKLKGVIGWDFDGIEMANKISSLSGDIEFEIDSPGGSVSQGISIANAIKNYNRGNCKMHVVGDCSSMALYIAMFGDGEIEFEPNSIAVAHNPWGTAVGDYRVMEKEGKILKQMSELYGKAFVRKGLFEESEIRALMDEETWFMGDNLKKLGKVLDENSSNDSDGTPNGGSDLNETPDLKIAAFRKRIEDAQAKIDKLKFGNELDKVAALISPQQFNGSTVEPKNGTVEEPKGETKMVKSLEELKTQNAAIYDEAKAEGCNAERKRVAALMKFNEIAPKAVAKAIEDGVGIADDDFQAAILEARIKGKEVAEMEKTNPPKIDPKTETHEPENKDGEPKPKTEEEKAKALKEAKENDYNALMVAMGFEVEK